MKKKILFLGLLVSSFFLATALTNAHAPSNVLLYYDFPNQTLDVIVNHTGDGSSHYINKIEIYVNDVLNHTENYLSQTDIDNQEDDFVIPAVDGDIIKATATCSISGSLTGQITVQEQVVPEFNKTLLFIPLSAVLIIGLALARRRYIK